MDATETISDRLDRLRRRIAQAELEFGRQSGSVALLAVSKGFPAEAIHAAALSGQRRFGENYLQESMAKIKDPRLQGLRLEWHFIGPIQSNKTPAIAEHFDWVHSVDRLNIAERLGRQRPVDLPPLNVCLQVNIDNEPRKSGVTPEQLPELAEAVARLPRLHLRGLMAIPAPHPDFAEQRVPFRVLRQALEELQANDLKLDTLSMGMTDDLEAAIAEGATMVRVGRGVFGVRGEG
ncbi:MAG: YggS family pyridoxal phosphate-dependent enzyme [Gammaproteobacteria bacterium]|nr:YggS family pyridoxal phosphate-dependent enzyme [Gammaproteobacteria bacterium]